MVKKQNKTKQNKTNKQTNKNASESSKMREKTDLGSIGTILGHLSVKSVILQLSAIEQDLLSISYFSTLFMILRSFMSPVTAILYIPS